MRHTKAKYLCLLLTAGLLMAGCKQQTENADSSSAEVTETQAETPVETPTETPTETPSEEPEETPADQDTDDMAVIAVTKAVTSADGKYSVKIPEDWEDMQDQINPEFSLEAGSLEEGAFIILNGEDKAGSALTSISEYASTLAGYISKSLTDVQIGERNQSTVNEKETCKQKLIGTIDGTKVAYWVYSIDGTNQYIQINAWCAEEHADRAELLFDQIVNSFQEL